MGRTSDAKQKLIDSAIELIHSRSYADVGVNELCQHAGVKKGSFYHFFPSKQDLTLTALDVLAEEFERRLSGPALSQELPFVEKVQHLMELSYQYHRSVCETTGHMRGCPFGNLAAELSTQDEALRLKVQHIFELMYQHQLATVDATGHVWGCPAGNLAVELSTQDEPIRLKVQQVFDMMTGMLDQVLQDGVSAGDLPKLDTATTARALLAYIEGVLLIAKTWNDPEIIRQLAGKIPQLLVTESV